MECDESTGVRCAYGAMRSAAASTSAKVMSLIVELSQIRFMRG